MSKKFIVKFALLSFILNLFCGVLPVSAANPGSVVINEIAWAGSKDSSNDEWIELFNATNAPIDLTGWSMKDDGVTAITFTSGAIPAYGYFLIEDSENVVSNVQSDLIANLSLANTGDKFELYDNTNKLIDVVNSSGGIWYAGSSSTYATMERKDATVGDIASNFGSSTGSGGLASAGSSIVGTPKALNSLSAAIAQAPKITLQVSSGSPQINSDVFVTAKVENIQDAFAYGLELQYDPTVLEYSATTQKGFLNQNGTISTSFQSGLKSNMPGSLLVAEARTTEDKIGVSGNGDLFEVKFKVKSASGNLTSITFNSSSFIASPLNDLSAQFLKADLTPILSQPILQPVTNLALKEGNNRYTLTLNWTASTSTPDKYRIERKDHQGNWVVLGETPLTQFTDDDSVAKGGKLIPKLDYFYRVIAIKSNVESTKVEAQGVETRGIKGDNNRSDLVDGRDLEALAKHFADDFNSPSFNALLDTTYDGSINGSDLIDIGVSFAKSYQ